MARSFFREVFGRRALRSSDYTSVVLFSLLVFIVGIVATSLFAQAITQQNLKDYNSVLDQESLTLSQRMEDRIKYNIDMLIAAQTFVNQKEQVVRQDWKTFYDDMRIRERFPYLTGVGYVEKVDSASFSSFEQMLRQEGFDGYTIHPVDGEPYQTPIKFIQPETAENDKALGYDMHTDPTRAVAMDEARDSGEAVMSAPVDLVQDKDKADARKGILLYYPVYRANPAPSTIAERRAQLRGFVYLILRPGDILAQYTKELPSLNDSMYVAMNDEAFGSNVQLYGGQVPAHVSKDAITKTRTFNVYNRRWAVSVTGHDSPLNRLYGPLGIFIMGTTVSVVAGLVTYYLLVSRILKVEKSLQAEVQRTKDELLALASHQLRTPASGVKQYLGMLSSGMMGELSPSQTEVVRKAYDTNERQIEIINELLYVSKIDAGQLLIEPTSMNLTRTACRAMGNFQEQAAAKDISLVCKARRPYTVHADDRYIMMVIENLISNAIKYSYPSTEVRVRLKQTANSVSVSVTDMGVGIAKRDIERVFEKFDRVENPLSHAEGGSGLGLFLARQLARAHGGDVTVVSAVDKGSTFTLTLPKESTIDRAFVSLKPVKKIGTIVGRKGSQR